MGPSQRLHDERARADAPSSSWLRDAALVVSGFMLVFMWLFAQPLFSGRLLAESDLFDQYLPLFLSPSLMWSSYEFGGFPAFADPENSAFYPVRWLFSHALHSWNGFIISAFILAGCFTYAYLYFHTHSRAAATFGATGFALSEAMLERVPHANILHAIVWAPLLLLAVDQMRASRASTLWVAVAAFAGACCLLAGHPQLALYVAYLSGAYALCGLIAERSGIVQWLRVAAAAAVALLLSAVVAVPLLELSGQSFRQTLEFDAFVDYSNKPWQMLSALFPVITHSGLEAPTYVGLLVLLCSILGATQLRSNWRIGFWVAIAVGAGMLGAGDATPLARVMYGLPLYDRFRIVSRHLIFATFAVNVLASYGLAAVLSGRVSRRTATLSGAVFAAMMIGAAVLLGSWPNSVRFDRLDERFPLPWLADRVWTQLLFAAVVLSAFVIAWRYRQSRVVAPLLVILLGADLVRTSSYDWTESGLVMPTVDAVAATPSVHARKLVSQLAVSGQRFLSMPDSLRDEVVPGMFARTWGIASAGGYTSLLLKDVSTLALMSSNGRVDPTILAPPDRALDLLAVKYVVFREPLIVQMNLPTQGGDARWKQVDRFSTSRTTDRTTDDDEGGENGYFVFENMNALPRAWLASEVLPTTDGAMVEAIRTSMLRDRRAFDPRVTALVFEGQVAAARYAAGGTADVVSIEDSRIAINVASSSGGFLVLSEVYYPGWQAQIDGNLPQPVHKTNLALQGITVPAGRHVVTFEFTPRSRRLGLALGAGGAVALIAMLVVGWRTSRA